MKVPPCHAIYRCWSKLRGVLGSSRSTQVAHRRAAIVLSHVPRYVSRFQSSTGNATTPYRLAVVLSRVVLLEQHRRALLEQHAATPIAKHLHVIATPSLVTHCVSLLQSWQEARATSDTYCELQKHTNAIFYSLSRMMALCGDFAHMEWLCKWWEAARSRSASSGEVVTALKAISSHPMFVDRFAGSVTTARLASECVVHAHEMSPVSAARALLCLHKLQFFTVGTLQNAKLFWLLLPRIFPTMALSSRHQSVRPRSRMHYEKGLDGSLAELAALPPSHIAQLYVCVAACAVSEGPLRDDGMRSHALKGVSTLLHGGSVCKLALSECASVLLAVSAQAQPDFALAQTLTARVNEVAELECQRPRRGGHVVSETKSQARAIVQIIEALEQLHRASLSTDLKGPKRQMTEAFASRTVLLKLKYLLVATQRDACGRVISCWDHLTREDVMTLREALSSLGALDTLFDESLLSHGLHIQPKGKAHR